MTMAQRDRLAIDTARSQQRQAGRVNLREMAARNVADKRARQAREGKARRAAALRRITPAMAEPVRPSSVPVTFKAERPERRRVEHPAKTIWQAATGTPTPDKTPEPVKVWPAPELRTRVHTPIAAAELDEGMRTAAMRIVRADSYPGWHQVGEINRESGRVTVFVRKHGTSARYSTSPAPEEFERIEHVPVKAVNLPKELRDNAKRALRGEFCDDTSGWLLAGPWERDGKPVNVYVRKHGASARYSTCN